MEVYRRMLRAKIHRAIVTDANLDYEGSLTIPPDILKLTDIREYEEISVWNVTRGTRFETYAIAGTLNSGEFCVNGAAAHLAKKGDIIIIASFADIPESSVDSFQPSVVFMDSNNRPIRAGKEVPGPERVHPGC
jgi:aspartate 1-decarboxylase